MAYRIGLGAAAPRISSVSQEGSLWHVWGSWDQNSSVLLNGHSVPVLAPRGNQRLDITDPAGPGTGGTFQVVDPTGASSNVISAGKVNSFSSAGNVALAAIPNAANTISNFLTAAPGYLQSNSLASMVGQSFPNWWIIGGGLALLWFFGKRGHH